MKKMNDIPKRVYLDIEITPDLGYAFGRYDTQLFEIQRDWYIQSIAWKWSTKHNVECVALPDFIGYKNHPFDDSKLLEVIWKILNEAEIVVTHNGDKFDLKKLNTRFLINGFDPPRPYKTVDTLKIARKKFGFSANSLNELCRQLNIGSKIQERKGLWKMCEDGDLRAWRERKEYNIHDVELGEIVYRRFLKWSDTFPIVHPDNGSCRRCGNTALSKRGFTYRTDSKAHRYQCTGCGSWSQGKFEKLDWDSS